MKSLSNGGLINLIELHHIIRNSREIFWIGGTDNSVTLSNGYILVTFSMPDNSPTYDVIAKRFNGRAPEGDEVLHSLKARKRFEISDVTHRRDALLRMFSESYPYDLIDTGLTIDLPFGGDDIEKIRAYYTECSHDRSYIFIAEKYHVLVDKAAHAYALKVSNMSPIIFLSATEYNEALVVLPIRTLVPAFVEKL